MGLPFYQATSYSALLNPNPETMYEGSDYVHRRDILSNQKSDYEVNALQSEIKSLWLGALSNKVEQVKSHDLMPAISHRG